MPLLRKKGVRHCNTWQWKCALLHGSRLTLDNDEARPLRERRCWIDMMHNWDADLNYGKMIGTLFRNSSKMNQ